MYYIIICNGYLSYYMLRKFLIEYIDEYEQSIKIHLFNLF